MSVLKSVTPVLIALAVIGFGPWQANAQSQSPSQSSPSSSGGSAAPSASGASGVAGSGTQNADDPLAADGDMPLPALDEPSEDMVEVSLGDWTLKNELADRIGVKVSAVPLTISVTPQIAGSVCPIDHDDLQQQQTVSATRTCAAKSVSDDLLAAVRDKIHNGDTEPR